MARRRKSKSVALGALSISELQSLLERKITQERKKLPALQKKRDRLASQIEEVEAQISALGGAAQSRWGAAKRRGRKVGRPAKKGGIIRAKRGGKMTIPAAIHQVLEKAGKPMRSSEIRDAILKRKLIKGVKKSFAAQVNIALGRHKEFKRKGRGLYSV